MLILASSALLAIANILILSLSLLPIKGLLSLVGKKNFLQRLTFDNVTTIAQTVEIILIEIENQIENPLVWSLWNPFELFHRKYADARSL